MRNSLNLPGLAVRVRPSLQRGTWRVCLEKAGKASDWLMLNPSAVAVTEKVSLLPPRLLGIFRLAYDSLQEPRDEGTQRTNG